MLAGTQLRRPEEAALLRSISGPLFRQQTAEAIAFTDRYAPLLMIETGGAQSSADSDHEA